MIVDLVRGRNASEALQLLQFTTKSGAPVIAKLLESAVANARQQSPGTDVDGDVVVDEPPVWATATPMPPTRRTPAMTAIATSRLRFWDGVLLFIGGVLCSMPPLSALKLGNPAEFSGNCCL